MHVARARGERGGPVRVGTGEAGRGPRGRHCPSEEGHVGPPGRPRRTPGPRDGTRGRRAPAASLAIGADERELNWF